MSCVRDGSRSDLEKLLSLRSVLKSNKHKNDDSGLTLKQLISVHESLLQSILQTKNGNAENKNGDEEMSPFVPVTGSDYDPDYAFNVPSIVSRCVKYHPEDAQLCTSILVSNNGNDNDNKYDDADILLVVQYLLQLSRDQFMFGSSSSSSLGMILDGVTNVTVPLLLSSSSSSFDSSLRDAILEATFSSASFQSTSIHDIDNNNATDANEEHENDNLQSLNQCLDLVYQSTVQLLHTPMNVNVSASNNAHAHANNVSLAWINTVVGIASRILEQLLSLTLSGSASTCTRTNNKNNNQEAEIILQHMHRLIMAILDALCFYSDKNGDGESVTGTRTQTQVPLRVNGKTVMLMRPITALLLPCLLECGDSDSDNHKLRMKELWEFICFLIDPNPNPAQGRVDGDSGSDSDGDTKTNTDIKYNNKRKCRSWDKAAPSVASALLCILAGVEQETETPMIQQSIFWNFIQASLTSSTTSREGTALGSDARGRKGGTGTGTGENGSISNPYQNGGEADTTGTELGGHGDDSDADVDQMVRRRAIHILSIVINSEYDEISKKSKGPKVTGKSGENRYRERIAIWKKYVLCFEALEMEVEAHLVDQVWSTVVELCAACVEDLDENVNEGANADECAKEELLLPTISWEWVGALFARVLMSHSPTLRKLGLFRLFLGQAGIKVKADEESTGGGQESQGSKSNNPRGKKGKQKGKGGKKGKAQAEPAPVSIISPSFLLNCLIPSFDSLVTSVGTGVNFEVNGKTANYDLSKMLPPFLTEYTKSLLKSDHRRLQEFVEGLLARNFLLSIKAPSLILIFDAVVDAWQGKKSGPQITLSRASIKEGVKGFQYLRQSGSVVFDFRQSLLLTFCKILSFSVLDGGEKPDPVLVLDVLSLYPAGEELMEPTEFDVESALALDLWLNSFGEGWSMNAGAACAASFISGHLLPFHVGDESGLVVTSAIERQRGAAIAKLCALSGSSSNSSPSSLLWPAIGKGLQFIPPMGQAFLPLPNEAGQKVARAILLLECGCQERILSGIGHGDLVLDKDGNMMPIPPAVELIISRAANFILLQVKRVSICNYDEHATKTESNSYGGRSTKSGEFANHFLLLIKQLGVLKKSYPSSVMMADALNGLLRSSVEFVLSDNEKLNNNANAGSNGSVEILKNMAIIYGVLTLGAEFNSEIISSEEEKEEFGNIVDVCSLFLRMTFRKPDSDSSKVATWQVKAMRSIFELTKWGCIFHLVQMAYNNTTLPTPALRQFHDEIMNVAIDSVNACPANALPVLFETVVNSAKRSFDMYTDQEKLASNAYGKNIGRIIDTIFAIMKDTAKNSIRSYMLNVTCSLIFHPQLMSDEFAFLQQIKERGGKVNMRIDAPIFQAFRQLMEQAGSAKPHISKYVLSYISVGWLGITDDVSKIGLAAIPYRQDIAKLMIHKEEKLLKSSAHQDGLVKHYDEGNSAILPDGVPNSSIARGFLMVFLSKLPDVDDMEKDVRVKLCHYIIMWLLDNVCLVQERNGKVQLTTGSLEYVQKIRAWQSVCMMHRFVTADIAEDVAKKVFESMTANHHGPIRYWMEVFTIQIARSNPTIFIDLFRREMKRCDITQQHVSSLMIIGGNLIVGRYSKSFLEAITDNNTAIVRDVIAGSVPWLSSTQGFSRAIAQLLVHKLIPLAKDTIEKNDDAFFLKTISHFLENNVEMKRLRKKQTSFFDSYDVDRTCTPEGMFSIDIDDGEESYPPHLVELLKKCLVDVYKEANSSNVPDLKQVEDELENLRIEDDIDNTSDEDHESDDALVNFQRKILPIDTLNLAIDDQKKLEKRNAAGRNRQSLIVCASLIDKVTNLAGLTRTAEIFAADKIVVPDAKVQKMDNFKSIAVGAEDWIDIEECKEQNLLPWLKERKREGYSIIGIEQTSSSSCLSHVQFLEKSVLLLGKEKEGIPVEFLQVVDQCVEIPQLGIIRSLNVHVSGAISIWEYTKQMMK